MRTKRRIRRARLGGLAGIAAALALGACGSSGTPNDAGHLPDTAADTATPDVVAGDLPDVASRDVVADVPAMPDLFDPGPPDLPADEGVAVPDEGPADLPDLSQPDVGPPLPEGCVLGDFHPYYGNMHAHTSYSDGEQTPADAFAYARDVAKLDLQWVTDHLEQLYVIPCLGPANDFPWCNEQAGEATQKGKFLAGCGFEYGTSIGGLTGHNNVFFPADLFPCLQVYFTDFYKSVAEDPDCIAQFNHPGDSATHNWKHFEYHEDVDRNMNLFEFNSEGDVWALYFEALDAGWHVSPQFNQDNHGADWGTKNDARSGFWMPELKVDALHAAMRERRTFATSDRNATIALKSAEGCWMGSILKKVKSVTVTVDVADPDEGDVFTALEFWGPKATQILSVDCAGAATCTASTTVQVTKPTYVFARALQADGQYLVAAPMWMEP